MGVGSRVVVGAEQGATGSSCLHSAVAVARAELESVPITAEFGFAVAQGYLLLALALKLAVI